MLIKSGGMNSVLMLWKCDGCVIQTASVGKIWSDELAKSEEFTIFIYFE